MSLYRKNIRIALLIICQVAVTAKAQFPACPPNIDFEAGNFSNWECRTGRVESIGGVNRITWEGMNELPENHKIIPSATAGIDIFGGFSRHLPVVVLTA